MSLPASVILSVCGIVICKGLCTPGWLAPGYCNPCVLSFLSAVLCSPQ